MPKIVYIAERKPGFSEEEFVARWRQHGALSMSLPMWSNTERYVQASVVHPAPVAGASSAYDAVGVCWFYSDGQLGERSAEQLEEVRILAADELETFAQPIAPVCIAAVETVLKAGEGPVATPAGTVEVSQNCGGRGSVHSISASKPSSSDYPAAPIRAARDADTRERCASPMQEEISGGVSDFDVGQAALGGIPPVHPVQRADDDRRRLLGGLEREIAVAYASLQHRPPTSAGRRAAAPLMSCCMSFGRYFISSLMTATQSRYSWTTVQCSRTMRRNVSVDDLSAVSSIAVVQRS